MIPVVFLVSGVIFELAGILVISYSIRIVSSEKRCGECDYDLRGHEDTPERCPECGRSLSQVGIVKISRKDNLVIRGAGIFLMIIGVGFIALTGLLIF